MKLKVLGSSSHGNCYILSNSSEALIIEAGLSLKEVHVAMNFKSNITGLIVSHQHNDHAGFIEDYVRAGIHVLALSDVFDAKNINDSEGNIIRLEYGKLYKFGNFKVYPFPVLHDVPCAGYLIRHPEMGTTFFATDTFSIAKRDDEGNIIPERFRGINHYMVEANYSDDILDQNISNGNIPAVLKKRLMLSHMEIGNTIRFLQTSDLSKVRDILLIHLSDGNSNEREFADMVKKSTGKRCMAAKPGMELDYDKRL
jgi:phosphoribosyl 1,2-cyclic phosphodiesterase